MLPVQRTIVPDVIRAQKLVTLTREASVRQAAHLMAERGIGAIMVVEELQLVGIFTERDITARVVAAGLDPDVIKLGQVMTPDPDTLKPTATVRDALDLMKRHGYRHLPVVQGRKLVGIVSIRDLYNTVMDQLEADILLLAEGLIHGQLIVPTGYWAEPEAPGILTKFSIFLFTVIADDLADLVDRSSSGSIDPVSLTPPCQLKGPFSQERPFFMAESPRLDSAGGGSVTMVKQVPS